MVDQDQEVAFNSYHGSVTHMLDFCRTDESILDSIVSGSGNDEKQEPSFEQMLEILINCIVLGHDQSANDFETLLLKAKCGEFRELEVSENLKEYIFDILMSCRKAKLLELFMDVGSNFGCGPHSTLALGSYKKAIRMGDVELINLFAKKNVSLGESTESKFSLIFQIFKMVQKPGKDFSVEVRERMTMAKALWQTHIEGKLNFDDPYMKWTLMKKLNLVILPTRWQRIRDNCRTLWFLREQGIIFDHIDAEKLALFSIDVYMHAKRHLSQILVKILDTEKLTREVFITYFRKFGKTVRESFKIMRKLQVGVIIYNEPSAAVQACSSKDPRFKVTRHFGEFDMESGQLYRDIQDHSEDMIEYLVTGGLHVSNQMHASRSISRRISNGQNTLALTRLSESELVKVFGVYPDIALEIMEFLCPRTGKTQLTV